MQSRITSHRKKEEGRRKKEEGRRKKEEGRRKKEEGRRFGSGFCNGFNGWMLKEEGVFPKVFSN
ncbi:hypothetical protein QUA20_15435 [Microcoleus sp. Pol7_A1]|uniref:hypothetical protein n=1 Tax=Microcoleus sp. Pol7_A1 TaxID=2818893 RepID=UPI002FD23F45